MNRRDGLRQAYRAGREESPDTCVHWPLPGPQRASPRLTSRTSRGITFIWCRVDKRAIAFRVCSHSSLRAGLRLRHHCDLHDCKLLPDVLARPAVFSADTLADRLRRRTVAMRRDLAAALGSPSRGSVARKLRQLGFLAGFSHRGCLFAMRGAGTIEALAQLARAASSGSMWAVASRFDRNPADDPTTRLSDRMDLSELTPMGKPQLAEDRSDLDAKSRYLAHDSPILATILAAGRDESAGFDLGEPKAPPP